MSTNAVRLGMLSLLLGTMFLPVSAASAAADEQAAAQGRGRPQPAAEGGYRTATRLGGSRSLYARCRTGYNERCIGTRERLQAAGKNARYQKDIASVMDSAGLTALTAQVLKMVADAAPDQVRETSFEIGRTMEWMGYWDPRRRRTDRIQMLRWGGRRPFGAWEFSIDDGTRLYTFVLPKACGNLTLASAGESPTAKAAEEERRRREQEEAARRAAEEERRRKEAEEAKRKQEEEARQAELRREPVCAITATATYAKSVWTFAIDGSGSASGDPAAATMTVQVLDPTGQPVSVMQGGQPVTELSLQPPFRAEVTARRLRPGTYTVRAVTSRNNNVAPTKTCEAQVTLERPPANVGFFIDGYGGKQRRVYEVDAPGGGTFFTGFCDGLVGIKGGPVFRVGERWQINPAIGVAINLEEGDRTSVFAEGEANYLLPKGFVGSGIGVWDFTHSDSVTASWLLHFGVQVWESPDDPNRKVYFVGEGRLFFDEIDDASNNYQFWGGLRFVFR